jgi:hypothetical protein
LLDRIVSAFIVDGRHASSAVAPASPRGSNAIQANIASVAKSYLSSPKAAVGQDWHSF